MADIVIIAIILAYSLYLVIKLARNKKKTGCSGCCQGCSGCSASHIDAMIAEAKKNGR